MTMLNRRNLLTGAVVAPIAATMVATASKSEPVFYNLNFNHSCADDFCGVQPVDKDRGFHFFSLRNMYPHELSQEEQTSVFPPMAFRIEKHKEEDCLAFNDPMVLFKRLPKYSIENNVHNFIRVKNRIAKNNRRGRGNVLIYNHFLSEEPHRLREVENPKTTFVHCDSFDKNEYVMIYKGSPYDAGIFKINTPSRPLYYANPNQHSKYMIRFELASYTNLYNGV